MKKHLFPLFASLLLWASTPGAAQAYTKLTDAYAALGFDPSASSNAVVVLFSDAHTSLDPNNGFITTNLNPMLVTNVNAMVPPPAKIVVAGDETRWYSVTPGTMPDLSWIVPWATKEMLCWLSAIRAFTNIAQTNILWVPGNHDQDPRETNAELFCQVFSNMPPYQSFDLAGVRFFLLNGGNIGFPSESEKLWLKEQVALTSPTQTVATVIHQPPFGSGRGASVMLRDCFRDWQARWWDFSGHAHSFAEQVFDIGRSNVTMSCIGTVSTNEFNGQTWSAGFMFLCLSNGIAGRIYYHFLDGSFQVVPEPDWQHPTRFLAAFEGVDGLLWRREKNPGPVPEVIVTNVITDVGYYYNYPKDLQWALPLGRYANKATHFLLYPNLDETGSVSFSTDRTNWIDVPMPTKTNNVYAFPIPAQVAAMATGYARLYFPPPPTNRVGMCGVDGWGLATTSGPPLITYPQLAQVTDQSAVAGRVLSVTNIAVDPYAPPDVLRFTLLNAPAGAMLDQRTGVFSWRPPIAAAPAIVPVLVKVADNGAMEMSATQQFWISVARPVDPVIALPQCRDGAYGFTVTGDTGLVYTVWASTNLLDWALLCATNPPTVPFQITDPDAASLACRFYRVIVGP